MRINTIVLAAAGVLAALFLSGCCGGGCGSRAVKGSTARPDQAPTAAPRATGRFRGLDPYADDRQRAADYARSFATPYKMRSYFGCLGNDWGHTDGYGPRGSEVQQLSEMIRGACGQAPTRGFYRVERANCQPGDCNCMSSQLIPCGGEATGDK